MSSHLTRTPALKASIRPLSTYNADQRRVLESRCYWARKTHHKTELEISAELNVRPEDLETLCPSGDRPAWTVPDPHGLADFRSRRQLGPDDLI